MTNTNQQEQLYSRQDVINAWNSAYGGDRYLSGEQYVDDLLPTPPVEDGKQGGEVKEEIISAIASALYNIRNSNQQPMMDTGKCDEIAEFIYMDIKDFIKSQPSPPVNKQD